MAETKGGGFSVRDERNLKLSSAVRCHDNAHAFSDLKSMLATKERMMRALCLSMRISLAASPSFVMSLLVMSVIVFLKPVRLGSGAISELLSADYYYTTHQQSKSG